MNYQSIDKERIIVDIKTSIIKQVYFVFRVRLQLIEIAISFREKLIQEVVSMEIVEQQILVLLRDL